VPGSCRRTGVSAQRELTAAQFGTAEPGPEYIGYPPILRQSRGDKLAPFGDQLFDYPWQAAPRQKCMLWLSRIGNSRDVAEN
jgi:hypothetical protein